MGCDIHIYLEVKDKNGKWNFVPNVSYIAYEENKKRKSVKMNKYNEVLKLFPNPKMFPDIKDLLRTDFGIDYDKYHDLNHPLLNLNNRDYRLFSILADVRNGYGFVPISDPKGVPDDASKEYKAEVKGWGYDGHSHSHFTLKELKDYDWNGGITCYGLLSEEEFLQWVKNGKGIPESYCAGIFGSTKEVSEQELNDIINKNINREKHVCYCVKVYWNEKCTDYSFYNKFIPWLEGLGIEPDNIRIVFFFDN